MSTLCIVTGEKDQFKLLVPDEGILHWNNILDEKIRGIDIFHQKDEENVNNVNRG